MAYCNCECDCSGNAVIAGIISGIILGVLYYFDLVATGVIFWVYLVFGLLAVLSLPIYGLLGGRLSGNSCYCANRGLLTTAAIGTVIAAAVGLIVSGVGSAVATTVVIAIATFFTALLIGALLCMSKCICEN